MSCYRLIEAEKPHHAVSRLCPRAGCGTRRLLRLGARGRRRSGLLDDALLGDQIRQIHARSRGHLRRPARPRRAAPGPGRPRRPQARRPADARARPAKASTAAGGAAHPPRPDGRAGAGPGRAQLHPASADRLWVADITQQRTGEGWLYLAVVLDAFSRRIVGWSMADHLRTELVLDALDMAVAQRQPAPGLVHHTDHGCQYTSLAFGRRLPPPAWSPRWAPSATRSTTPSPRASSPPSNASCSTATTGQPAKPYDRGVRLHRDHEMRTPLEQIWGQAGRVDGARSP